MSEEADHCITKADMEFLRDHINRVPMWSRHERQHLVAIYRKLARLFHPALESKYENPFEQDAAEVHGL